MINEFGQRKYCVMGIGEVMLRLSTVGNERISNSESFEKKAGGSELNVISGLALLGMDSAIITRLPKNEIGKFVARQIKRFGVGDEYLLFDESPDRRLGIYYYESGAYPRQSVVSYDRKRSSFTGLKKTQLPDSVFSSTNVFHTSGITLALDSGLRETVIEMMTEFKLRGATVSFDVNYRSALWDESEARATVSRVLPLVDVLFVSEETLRRMLGYSGDLRHIHRQLAQKYPGLEIVASTRRRPITPRKHDFGSLIYDCRENLHFEERDYEGIDVVDRIGSGDAFVAGALYGLCRYRSIEQIAKYGNAMAALKNTVMGDASECDLEDVERTIVNHNLGGSGDEMVR